MVFRDIVDSGRPQGRDKEETEGQDKAALCYGYHKFLLWHGTRFRYVGSWGGDFIESGTSNLKLIAVIPYDGQNERWSAREQDRYWDILDKADDAILLSKHYFNGCLLRRNDYMLSHSCGLIAFFDGKPKGRHVLPEKPSRWGWTSSICTSHKYNKRKL